MATQGRNNYAFFNRCFRRSNPPRSEIHLAQSARRDRLRDDRSFFCDRRTILATQSPRRDQRFALRRRRTHEYPAYGLSGRSSASHQLPPTPQNRLRTYGHDRHYAGAYVLPPPSRKEVLRDSGRSDHWRHKPDEYRPPPPRLRKAPRGIILELSSRTIPPISPSGAPHETSHPHPA